MLSMLVVAIAMTKQHDQNNLGKILYCLPILNQSQSIEGSKGRNSQGRKLERGADVETRGKCRLLASPHDLFSLLGYRTQDHQSRDGTVMG